MSHCLIKARKAKVKLIYENNFDFSYNDPNECIFESARNEIKIMLQQELEFFLSKLKIKINDLEIPFLSNCEKCKSHNEGFEITDIGSKNKQADEFDEIFHIILEGNSSSNNLNTNKRSSTHHHSSNQTNTNINNHSLSIKEANHLNHANTISTFPTHNQQNTRIDVNNTNKYDMENLNANLIPYMNNNNHLSFKDIHIEGLNTNSKDTTDNLGLAVNLDKSENPVIDFLKPKNNEIASTCKNNTLIDQNTSLTNLMESSSIKNNSLVSNKTAEKEQKDKEKNIINLNDNNTNQKIPISSNILENDYFDKNANKEEIHDDDLSSIHSNNLEPNFLKGNINRDTMEGASLNSYENLTVLEEGKSIKEGDYQDKSGYEGHFQQGHGNQKKMKIGCFMDDDTGRPIDLLICDNFKSRYESSIHPNILKNTSQFISTKQLNLLEKNKCLNNNHKIYLLYGNIAYSMGSYHKAQKFYQTGINTIIDENKDTPNFSNYTIIKSLLQNNLAKCMINSLNIKSSISVLMNAISALNEKLSYFNEIENLSGSNNNNINLDNNLNTNINVNPNTINNNLRASNKHFIYKLKLLKFILDFNLAEAYYFIEDYKQSHIILERIFEELTSESTLGYYESHNIADLSYDDKEISKFFVKYYYIIGKIQYRLDNLQLAMESFTQSINLRGDDKNEHKEDLAQIYNYIALIYCKQNQVEKANKFISKALNIYWLLYGEEHIKTNMVQLNLSYIQKMKGENLKCLESLNKIRENFIRSRDAEKIFGAVIYRAIGTCYFEMENEIKGLSFYTKANNIYKKYFVTNKITMNEINSIILNLFGLINI